MREMIKAGEKLYSRDGRRVGRMTGGCRCCQLSGCSGIRIAVKWSDGKITYPCSKGLKFTKRGLRIV